MHHTPACRTSDRPGGPGFPPGGAGKLSFPPHFVSVTRVVQDFPGLDVPDERVIVPRHERQADELSAQ